MILDELAQEKQALSSMRDNPSYDDPFETQNYFSRTQTEDYDMTMLVNFDEYPLLEDYF